jgi:DNA-binding transcriptional regulator GbsR (MarR family)
VRAEITLSVTLDNPRPEHVAHLAQALTAAVAELGVAASVGTTGGSIALNYVTLDEVAEALGMSRRRLSRP